MNRIEVMNLARKMKYDEFYTRYKDVESELQHYNSALNGKSIYCNCDDASKSNFFKYLYENFRILNLKSISASFYCDHNAYLVRYDGRRFYKRFLNGNGDFRSKECIDILKQSDVVITNPPFSLYIDFIDLLLYHNKDFIILTPVNKLSYRPIRHNIRDGKISTGNVRFVRYFDTPDQNQNGSPTTWLTSFTKCVNKPLLKLVKSVNDFSYKKFDNLNAINVDKVKDIPFDYPGVIGVPITFLISFNKTQFSIVGHDRSESGKIGLYVDGKRMFKRLLIKKVN